MSGRSWVYPFSLLAASLVAAACSSSGDPAAAGGTGPNGGPPATTGTSGTTAPPAAGFETIEGGFESDDPASRNNASSSGGTDAGASAGGSTSSGGTSGAAPPATDAKGEDAARAVEEADIVKVEENRLFALSQYGGLAAVDVTDPDRMKLLGRRRTNGIPFEMYVRGGRAYVMLNDHGRWVRTDAGGGQWVQSSEIVAFDVSNPAAIHEVAHYDVPGTIADSRLVGDAFYVVTYENGYCWGCDTTPATIVTSFNVGGGSTIAKVEQLRFGGGQNGYSWQRSVSATNQRLYIAGPSWDWTPGAANGRSVIQVVDISDPAGHLKKGADVPVAGQINNRWQMDEHAGVLRVVSQFGNGWWAPDGTINPMVQTFTVASANSITPLGQTYLTLPAPESLRSVRFDGPRGYAITAQQTDPLFTIDLSNPALPKQVGTLEMPGWILHMEPRGDRLVGFGYADTTWNAGLAVSLFDVSDLAKPAMLKRVNFGAGWGSYAEDQDRIHKSVKILEAQGLVLVPFASYGRWEGDSCTPPQSGIQLIDIGRSDLTLRGLAPQHGQPRRALIVNERLLAVSDRNVTAFDITSRDAPRKSNEIDLSNPAYRMVETGGHIASITNDWFTGEVMLSLTPKANADDANATGKVSLASLAPASPSTCGSRWGWSSWYEARLFAHGHHVYVTVPVTTYAHGPYYSQSNRVVVAAIDVSDPRTPRIVGHQTLALTDNKDGYWGRCGVNYDGYSFYSSIVGGSSLVGAGEGIVQVGSRLAYLELVNEQIPLEGAGDNGSSSGSYPYYPPFQSYTWKLHRKLHVVDFADPTSPRAFAPIALPESLGSTPLHVADGAVLTSRWIKSPSNPGKVRFYVDRVSLLGPEPQLLASINTPGSLVHVDALSRRIVTADYRAHRAQADDWQQCYALNGYRAYFDYATKECISVDRNLKLSELGIAGAKLLHTFELPSQNVGGVQLADDRIYVTHYPVYDHAYACRDGYCAPPRLVEEGGLWAIGGIRAGALTIASELKGNAEWPLAARGTKVALYAEGGLAIYDTAAAIPVRVAEERLRGWGYSSHVLMGEGSAVASLGEFGLQTIRY